MVALTVLGIFVILALCGSVEAIKQLFYFVLWCGVAVLFARYFLGFLYGF